jgi:hypothetical protein
MTSRFFKLLAFASLAALLDAQSQGAVNGPVAGYVFDTAAQGLRPILGLPGASRLGNPLSFGYQVAAAFVAPRLDTVLAVAPDGASHFFSIQNGALNEIAVNGLASAASPYLVSFSPSGKSLALYNGKAVQILTGLPASPQVSGAADLTSVGLPSALALSDDGAALLVSVNNSIHLFASSADLGKLMDTSASPAFAFAIGSHDAAISDTGAGLVLYRDLTGSGASQVVAAPDPSAKPSSALAFSADGTAIYLANASTQTITRFDLTAGASASLPCSCTPTTLARMGNVFRLTELSSDPLWLLDRPDAPQSGSNAQSGTNARVVFVPALVESVANPPRHSAPVHREPNRKSVEAVDPARLPAR